MHCGNSTLPTRPLADGVAGHEWDDRAMNAVSFQQATPAVLALVAVYVMIDVGLARRLLAWRGRRCGVCHRPRTHCVCRWR